MSTAIVSDCDCYYWNAANHTMPAGSFETILSPEYLNSSDLSQRAAMYCFSMNCSWQVLHAVKCKNPQRHTKSSDGLFVARVTFKEREHLLYEGDDILVIRDADGKTTRCGFFSKK